MERLLEISLQTILQLPERYRKQDYSPKKLKLLVSHLHKVGEEAETLLQKEESMARLRAYVAKEIEVVRARLLRVTEEMRWAADTLSAMIKHTRFVRPKVNSPNPQVGLALYIVGWFEASTGREQYASLETLLAAAFSTAGEQTPKWAGRLAIEMHNHRKRRREYASSLRDPNKTQC